MLQNDYLVAKIGVDTAENEPYVKSDVSWLPALGLRLDAIVAELRSALDAQGRSGSCNFKWFVLGDINADFSIKYSFFSIFQDLQDFHNSAPLGTQIFGEICPKFPEFC